MNACWLVANIINLINVMKEKTRVLRQKTYGHDGAKGWDILTCGNQEENRLLSMWRTRRIFWVERTAYGRKERKGLKGTKESVAWLECSDQEGERYNGAESLIALFTDRCMYVHLLIFNCLPTTTRM